MLDSLPVTSFIFAITSLLICLISFRLLDTANTIETHQVKRFKSIDGLRGYLAFSVFLHHAVIWFYYLKTSAWTVPPSNLYTHFGQSGVALFFMITAFLFTNKLIQKSEDNRFDWFRLYISRLFRLTPLYLTLVLIVLLVVCILSDWQLRDGLKSLALSILMWISFSFPWAPDINGVEKTRMIVAGVTWSLPYEWLFYFSLPLIGLLLRIRVPIFFLILGIISCLVIIFHSYYLHSEYRWITFLGGILAAFIVQYESITKIGQSNIAALVAIFALLAILFFPSAYHLVPITLLTIFFIIVACGNSLFGLLETKFSVSVGEIAYSIYLIHGLILFICFKFIFGFNYIKNLDPLSYWLIISLVIPFLIFISNFTYKFIEKPGLDCVPKVLAYFNAINKRQ